MRIIFSSNAKHKINTTLCVCSGVKILSCRAHFSDWESPISVQETGDYKVSTSCRALLDTWTFPWVKISCPNQGVINVDTEMVGGCFQNDGSARQVGRVGTRVVHFGKCSNVCPEFCRNFSENSQLSFPIESDSSRFSNIETGKYFPGDNWKFSVPGKFAFRSRKSLKELVHIRRVESKGQWRD